MSDPMTGNASRDDIQCWLDALTCQDVVLRFMGCFDARDWEQMMQCVTPDVVWQRPDRKISGLEQLRQTLHASPDNVRVRHIITNLRPSVTSATSLEIHSYFSVFRVIGIAPDSNEPAPCEGPVSVGRYRDVLVQTQGGWRIASKETHVDFRRS